jgi:hypothetical protein
MSGADSDATTMQFGEPAAAAAAAVAQRNPASSLSPHTEPTAVRGRSTAAAPAVPRSGTAGSGHKFSFDAPAATTAQQSAQPPRARSHADTAANGITLQSAPRERPAVTPSTASTAAAAATSQLAGDRKRSRTSLPAAAAVSAAMTFAAIDAAPFRHTTGNATAAAAAAAAVSKQTANKQLSAPADSMSVNSVRDYMRGANTELMANEGVSRAFAKLLFECHSAVEDAYSVSHGEQRDCPRAAAVAAAEAEAAAAAMVAESRDRTSVHKAAEQDYLRNASNHLLAADNITVAYKHSLNSCYWAIMKKL